MSKKRVTATVTYIPQSGGFWGLIGENGEEWRPVSMPEQLKYNGKKVDVVLDDADDDFSIYMWGTPVVVVSFQTPLP